ncbi:MAG: hydrogenase formation protein HypD [Candidatus Marinimicrobia bacterium]|jgi:hydrogenase expression/formation protein HypD|nr:hydrogenase formation protein HypD [Candidatus Neomarinimicrobiota bacterium]MDP6456577.1 hydrogenase formation protein HypD [Candidatus Neomarinimicrobiota bacterium]MDP6593113.1 hydrogenase formation protein HypD [Candidatus Neomarinimicrobiota bacterium]MDP6836794.1 hydrogenase formation protein HypD [Candidatus Neomarinimicrobiota bacterium]MDP6965782.1 hydrogenase formation protein HypD [Candidatus Neomarinimicrobiota bacterium]|tara:strand:- start:8215 stop:9309 length:1095 start_codon:yes stop_codon:yes gene_type:complete
MKYLDEFRNPEVARTVLAQIRETVTRPWVLMEVCGGQTHSIIKNGIDQLLPKEIELVHGPGCPVCVTPLEIIDQAIAIASRPEVIFTSFGDMLRVPGSEKDLLMVKSEGGDVRTVYSPLESVKIAGENAEREVVFFAVGFETTAPGNAMAIHQAAKENLANYSQLVSHVLVPPAMEALLSSPKNRVQGYLAAGHVCTVMGLEEYEPIAEKYAVPIVATGFEPVDVLEGILMVVKQLEAGRHEVENQYLRSVKREGNRPAQDLVSTVFEVSNRKWRGIGEIPSSGLKIKDSYRAFDAELKFAVGDIHTQESELCISGVIMQGLKKPHECPAFGKECTPTHPLGATMVSSEGACSAYFKYQRVGNL